MAKIELNNEQLRIIQTALDFYSRVGTLQFEEILRHPTIEKCLMEQFRPIKKLEVGDSTERGVVVKITNKYVKTKGSWGNGEEIRKWTDIDNIKISIDYGAYHNHRFLISNIIESCKRYIDKSLIDKQHFGIYSDKVDDSCRVSFDILQYIRHEFWKENPNRSNMTVDSSLSLTSETPHIKVELDSVSDIRKRKLDKLG